MFWRWGPDTASSFWSGAIGGKGREGAAAGAAGVPDALRLRAVWIPAKRIEPPRHRESNRISKTNAPHQHGRAGKNPKGFSPARLFFWKESVLFSQKFQIAYIVLQLIQFFL